MTLKEEIDSIYAQLGELPDTAEAIKDDLSKTNAYLARSGNILAQAKAEVSIERGRVMYELSQKHELINFTTLQFKELINAKCARTQQLVDLADRVNATCVHRIDSLRSLLSYEKQQLIEENR